MAPWTVKEQPAQPQAKSDDQDISSLLSAEQRADLTLLIAGISEKMRKSLILNTFDPSLNIGKSPQQALNLTDAKNPNIDADHEETEEEEKGRKLREKRNKELSEPKQQELKLAALEYLSKWQDSVITRVGEAVNVKREADLNKQEVRNTSSPAVPPVEDKKINQHSNVEDADAALIELYPPTSTSLYSLPLEKRTLLLKAMLLLLLSLEHYSAYSRVLLLHIASSLHLPLHVLSEFESSVAQGLVEAAKHMSGEEETAKRSEDNKVARRWKVGLAGVAGAALIGVTGGLAAPLVAAGIGSVMGGLGLGATAGAALLGTLAESGLVVGALFGAYGGRMTSKMMDAYAKEVEDFAFLPLRGETKKRNWHGAQEASAEDRRLRVSIGISGWLTRKEDVIDTWRVFGHQSEVFALRWELNALMNLGTSLESVVKSYAWSVAKKEIIARTMFAALMDALWPIALLKVSKVIDNPFSVAKNRADKAGLVLADALINKAQGERPVTLVGYSLGARMIYSCLMSLAERKAFGLVESVVLIGTPMPSEANVWRTMRSVVAGRLVNVYSENDYILAFLYRTSSIQYGIAGIQEVTDVPTVQNVNVSDMVNGHLKYQYLVGSILEKIGWEDLDTKEIKKEEETLELLEEQDQKEEDERQDENLDPDKEALKLEKEVKEKTMFQKGKETLGFS